MASAEHVEPAAEVLRRHLLVTAQTLLDLIIVHPVSSEIIKDLFRLLDIAGVTAEQVAEHWVELQQL